jgi:hypothetical protein
MQHDEQREERKKGTERTIKTQRCTPTDSMYSSSSADDDDASDNGTHSVVNENPLDPALESLLVVLLPLPLSSASSSPAIFGGSSASPSDLTGPTHTLLNLTQLNAAKLTAANNVASAKIASLHLPTVRMNATPKMRGPMT